MGLILQRPEILRRYAWEDLEVDRENPMSNGLLMFVIPATEGSGARDIARPWVGRFLTSQIFANGTEGDSYVNTGGPGYGNLPALSASITKRSCLYFGNHGSSGSGGFGYVFIGGADGGGEFGFGLGNGNVSGARNFGGLYGGAYWANSGISLAGYGGTNAGSIGYAADSSGTMSAVVDGNYLGTVNLGGDGGATTTFGFNGNNGGQNATGLGGTHFRAMLLWRGAVSVPTMQTLHRNPYALLRLKQARRTFFIAPAGGVVTRDIAGSGSFAFGGSADIAVTRQIAGTGSASFSGTGEILVTRAIAGSGSASFGGTADITVTRQIAGTGAVAFSGTATVTVGNVVTRDIAGSGNVAFGGSAEILVTRSIAGSGSVIFSGSGQLIVTRQIAGAGSVVFTGTATVTNSPPFTAPAPLRIGVDRRGTTVRLRTRTISVRLKP